MLVCISPVLGRLPYASLTCTVVASFAPLDPATMEIAFFHLVIKITFLSFLN